jgi:hypothetical protein
MRPAPTLRSRPGWGGTDRSRRYDRPTHARSANGNRSPPATPSTASTVEGGPVSPPPCRRCGSLEYSSAGLCAECHQYGPKRARSCPDCGASPLAARAVCAWDGATNIPAAVPAGSAGTVTCRPIWSACAACAGVKRRCCGNGTGRWTTSARTAMANSFSSPKCPGGCPVGAAVPRRTARQ